METMTLRECYRQARQSIDSGESGRGIAISEHVLEQYPKAIEALVIRAEALSQAGRLEEAIANFDRVLEMDPLNAAARRGKGLACRDLGRTPEAIRELEWALEIEPSIENVRDELVRLYGQSSDSERSAVRLNRIGLARLYAKGNLLVQAASEYKSILETEPNRLDVRLALAETLWREGKTDEAAGISQSILSDNPECLRANLFLAGIYLQSNREEEARALLQVVQEEDPNLDLAKPLVETAGVPVDWLPLRTEEPTVPAFPEYVEASFAVQPDGEAGPEDIAATGGELASEAWESPWAEAIEEEAEARATERLDQEESLPSDATEPDAESQSDQDLKAYLATEMVDLSPDLKPFSWDEAETEAVGAGAEVTEPTSEVTEPTSEEVEAFLSAEAERVLGEAGPAAKGEQPVQDVEVPSEAEIPILSADEIRRFNDNELTGVLPFKLEDAELAEPTVEAGSLELEEAEAEVEQAEVTLISPPPGPDEGELIESKEDEVGWGGFAAQEAPATAEEPLAAVDKAGEAVQEEVAVPMAAASQEGFEEARPAIAEPVVFEKASGAESARLVAAEGHRQAGDWGRALGEYRALMKEQPSLLPEIVKGLHGVLTNQPDNAAAHRLLGDAYMKQGMYQKAMSEFRRVLSKPAKRR